MNIIVIQLNQGHSDRIVIDTLKSKQFVYV